MVVAVIALLGVTVAVTAIITDRPRGDPVVMSIDGRFYPISDAEAGQYLTVGPREGDSCNWAISDKPYYELEHIAKVGSGPPSRNTTVSLKPGEYFVSWGCRPWRRQ